VEFARQALHDLIRNHDAKPDVDSIQKTVSDFFHIRLADLKSKKRTQHIAFCRQVAMYLSRKLTDSSFPTIGDHFSRDHSTVIHAYNLILRRVSSDSAFRLSIEKLSANSSRFVAQRNSDGGCAGGCGREDDGGRLVDRDSRLGAQDGSEPAIGRQLLRCGSANEIAGLDES